MDFLFIIISGIVGAAAMTIFTYLATFITDRVMKVTKILGTMLASKTTSSGGLSENKGSISLGVAAHYFTGIIFAFCYLLLWRVGIGKPTFLSSLVFGFVNGLIGIAIWRMFFFLHPHPPAIKLRMYLFTLLMAHIAFALTVVRVFNWLQGLR